FPNMIPKQCEVCRKVDADLQRCAGCSAHYYCSRGHQGLVYPQVDVQANQRRKKKGPRRGDQGQLDYWAHLELRPWLSARFLYGELLIRFWRRQDIKNTLGEYLSLLQDNRGDDQGTSDLIPHLQIRLGRGEDAYDLIKWPRIKFKGVNRNDKLYRWGDPTKRFLDIKNEDMSEDLSPLWIG
ncbi:hypothetical protein QBC44DRAFT_208701, partial [Cladorrhinum sp. PSN332]